MKNLSFKKTLALLPLVFAGNTYAIDPSIDTYSFTTKTLKIPQVMVGDTTYNDVVLKLNDFEVLAVNSDHLTGILKDGIVLQFISAVRQAGQLHVTLTLTSKDKDRSPYLNGKYRVTDNKGSVYDYDSSSVPRDQEYNGRWHLFDADTPVTVIHTFDKFDPQATQLNFLEFNIGDRKYTLRDIPVEEFTF